ncbi:MAG: DbpA RNA binding domain-containing protein [Gemmatimonadaceae bacterium]
MSSASPRGDEIYNITGAAQAAPRRCSEDWMLESEEVGDRPETQAGRGQNLIYTLPHTAESIAEFLPPVLSRIDPAGGGTQVVVVTRSPETAIAVAETILGLSGAAGIEVVPVTGAARAARIFKARPVLAVAGTAEELGALVGASVLKLDTVRIVVLAWADDILENGPETVGALEALLAELGDASRVIVARKLTPAVEDLVERYARRARRVPLAEVEVPIAPADYQLPHVKYVTIGGSARGSALRRLLDDLDPPSATIIARGGAALAEVRHILRTLGYEHNDDPIHATEGELKGDTHAVIYYQPPVTSAQLHAAALAKPAEVVVLAQPAEVAPLRELAGGRLIPLTLQGPERRAQDREDAVRQELRAVLTRGVPPREIIFLEPLLEAFDAVEVAAAALQLLDRERAQRRHAAEAATRTGAASGADAGRATTSSKSGGEMIRLFMTIGTRDGVKTGDLMGAIAGEGGIPADRVGKIDLRESHSLVEVAAGDAASVVARLNGATIQGRRVVVRGERDKEDRDRAGSGRERPDRDGGRDRGRPPGRDRPAGRMDRGDAGSRPPRRSGPPRGRDRS